MRVRAVAGMAFAAAGPGLQGRSRAAGDGRHALPKPAARRLGAAPPSVAGLFDRFAIDLAAQQGGRAVVLLQAGCTTAGPELDLAALRASGVQLEISLIDDSSATTRAAVAARPDLQAATLSELWQVPLRQRSYDIVQCSLLLHRISNAELVLDRLAAAVRPGGLLLVRMIDPASAFGFLDRRLPEVIRTIGWRTTRPGEPGPSPALYEPVASGRGFESFLRGHDLAVAHRSVARSVRSAARPAPARLAGGALAWLSHERLAGDHDELCYVIRRPEYRFARVLQ